MANNKISKSTMYDDPTAFKKRFPRIKPVTDRSTLMAHVADTQAYKMGKLLISITPPRGNIGYFMSIHGKDTYPTWDEMVWIRYNLIPDAAVMSMIMPNLNSYINMDDTRHKFTFTFEQKGWVLDPAPACPDCGEQLRFAEVDGIQGKFKCDGATCHFMGWYDMSEWNEAHGNGKMARNG